MWRRFKWLFARGWEPDEALLLRTSGFVETRQPSMPRSQRYEYLLTDEQLTPEGKQELLKMCRFVIDSKRNKQPVGAPRP